MQRRKTKMETAKGKEICDNCKSPILGKIRGRKQGHKLCFNCYRKKWRLEPGKTKAKVTTKLPEPTSKVDEDKFNKEFSEYKSQISKDMQKLIPEENGYIDETGLLKEMKEAYKYNFMCKNNSERFNFLLVGDAGVGKTQAGVSFAHDLGVPHAVVTFNGAITPEQLIGFQKLIINEKGVQEQVWQDGILTKFVREGGVLNLDEVNASPPEISFILFPLLDKLRRLDLLECNGEVIKAHRGFFVIGTMNDGFAGTNELNQALASRFNQKRTLEFSESVAKKLVKQGKILNNSMVELVRKQIGMWKNGQYSMPLSIRDLIVFKMSYDTFGEKTALVNLCENFKTDEEKKALIELYELEVAEKVVPKKEKENKKEAVKTSEPVKATIPVKEAH
jgi:hypothetical protein